MYKLVRVGTDGSIQPASLADIARVEAHVARKAYEVSTNRVGTALAEERLVREVEAIRQDSCLEKARARRGRPIPACPLFQVDADEHSSVAARVDMLGRMLQRIASREVISGEHLTSRCRRTDFGRFFLFMVRLAD